MAVKADITIDIDKQVGNLQNLTNIYNARVGDNKTPLTVLWRKNGMALNLKGLHAFIAGKVGDGSYNAETDKVDFPVGTPVVKYEDDGSGTLDNGQSGLTTLLIPKQMWAKTGLFAGYIGLKDENGSVFTSKDIFFKVLGNVLDAGVAINYFIDDFSKVIQNSKLKLQKNIDDARNAYESETKNAHDAALAANAELSELREDITKASHSIGDVQNQIDADDIVTTNEFKKVTDETKNLINDRLKHISSNPETFASLDALKAKYPNGADGLFRVGNEGYIWENNAWTSTGEIASTMISDADFNQRLGSFMFFDNDQHVEITERYSDDLSAQVGTMTVSKGILIYLADQGYFKSTDTLNLKYTYTQTQVDQNGCMTLYFDNSSQLYFAFKPVRRNDLKLFSIYKGKIYGGINTDRIYVNGVNYGGWGSDSVYGYAMLLPMFPDNDNHIEVEYKNDKDNWKYKVTYSSMNIIGSNGSHVTAGSGTVEGQSNAITPLNLYYSPEDKNCYLDTHGHNSNDYFIGTLYGQYAYGQNVDAFVVNGFSKGGFGKPYRPYTLTDWRIDAENSQESNIVWFGDSTFAGYKVKDSKNIAANYINNFLVTNFPKVRSYNCSISGWTTWALADAFEKQIANIPTPKLVLIGGGINDVSGGMGSGKRIVQSREGLRNFVRKIQSIGAVPIICTTQASMLLYARYAEGGDWDLEQNWYARINEMRREFAKENNLPLLDMEKFDTAFIEYGPSKLNEMFDDQMHGHDPINRFEAQLVMAYLSKDQLDFINHDQIIDLSTMKAKSTSEYNKTNQELDDPVFNAKGFKSHMVRSNVDSDLTIIDYQFFIPASEEQYYLNGYNLGDPVNVSLNGNITQLTGTQKVATLEPGYYHVIVKPTTANINFVGLRIETDNLTKSTVKPASGTTPATPQPTTPQVQPTEPKQ